MFAIRNGLIKLKEVLGKSWDEVRAPKSLLITPPTLDHDHLDRKVLEIGLQNYNYRILYWFPLQKLPPAITSPSNWIFGNSQVINWLEELLCRKADGDDKLQSMQAILKVFHLAAKEEKERMDSDFDMMVAQKEAMEVSKCQNEM